MYNKRKKMQFNAGSLAQVAECLPSKCMGPSSNSATAKKKKEKKKMKKDKRKTVKKKEGKRKCNSEGREKQPI
jgi:hypothetical protein